MYTMRDFRLILLISFLAISCKQIERPKIEKFIWIRHNLNWIHDLSDLQARYYLSYNDSLKTIFYAHNNSKVKQVEYYDSSINDSIGDMIFKNFYKKSFSNCLIGQPSIYDGDFYCVIYKFENEPEHFINYLPFAISDSLKIFMDYVEKATKNRTNKPTKPFDISSNLIRYKDTIVECFPPAPTPAEIEQKVNFKKPKYDKK